MKLKPRISKVSKLDGIRSWSLQAIDTCPGSKIRGSDDLVDACKTCYATIGNYNFPNVKEPRAINLDAWKDANFVGDMVSAIGNDPYFRWFDSGDMYHIGLARKILRIMELTPNTRHWMPTRMSKFPKFARVIEQMQALPNVMVRFSSDSVMGEFEPGLHGSTIIPTAEHATDDMSVCRAYENNGKCSGCRACWNKNVPVIAYVAHGAKAKKVIRLKLETA